jgi:hypothetical protein
MSFKVGLSYSTGNFMQWARVIFVALMLEVARVVYSALVLVLGTS